MGEWSITEATLENFFSVAETLGYRAIKAKASGRVKQSLLVHACNEVSFVIKNLEKFRQSFKLDAQEEQTFLVSALTHDAGKRSKEFSSYLDLCQRLGEEFEFLWLPRVEHVAELEIEKDVRDATRMLGYSHSIVDAAASLCLLHHRKSRIETKISALLKEYRGIRTGLLSDLLTFVDHLCSVLDYREMSRFIYRLNAQRLDNRINFIAGYFTLQWSDRDPDIIMPEHSGSNQETASFGVRLESNEETVTKSRPIRLKEIVPACAIAKPVWDYLLKKMPEEIPIEIRAETPESDEESKTILGNTLQYYSGLLSKLRLTGRSDKALAQSLINLNGIAAEGDQARLRQAILSFERDYHMPTYGFRDEWYLLTHREFPSVNPFDENEENNYLRFLLRVAEIIQGGTVDRKSKDV